MGLFQSVRDPLTGSGGGSTPQSEKKAVVLLRGQDQDNHLDVLVYVALQLSLSALIFDHDVTLNVNYGNSPTSLKLDENEHRSVISGRKGQRRPSVRPPILSEKCRPTSTNPAVGLRNALLLIGSTR